MTNNTPTFPSASKGRPPVAVGSLKRAGIAESAAIMMVPKNMGKGKRNRASLEQLRIKRF